MASSLNYNDRNDADTAKIFTSKKSGKREANKRNRCVPIFTFAKIARKENALGKNMY